MQLIGMLDSPYVRRSAIALDLLGIPFEHRSVSVLTQIEEFSRINPVLKVPTLVLDDGSCLMDSGLIIDHAVDLAGGRTLLPADPAARTAARRALGLALAACDKTVQAVYEYRMRPEEKRHAPWLDRVCGQVVAACRLLEAECAAACWDRDAAPGPAGVTAAVVWTFMTRAQPHVVDAAHFPCLAAWAAQAEALPVFRRYPHP